MIMSQEQAFLKAYSQLQAMCELVARAGEEGWRVDEVERAVFSQLMAAGLTLLQGFVRTAGDGDAGPTLDAAEGQTLKRLKQRRPRRYLSIFGELQIGRWVYARREGQKIERVPLDERLGLPAGEFSYVLEDWLQRICIKESFDESVGSLRDLLGVAPSGRAAEVLDEVQRRERSAERPRPQHKTVWAEMTTTREGEACTGRERLFIEMAVACHERDRERQKPLVCLMDGEASLWQIQREWLPRAIGILDLFHVLERLWGVAHCFHPEKSREAEEFVTHRLRMLLEGRVGYVIGGLRRLLKKSELRGEKRRTVTDCIRYHENNRDHMRYDEYLAAGYPIGSGVAEGACRHLVKDRMEQTGMRWTPSGAQAMLHLRAIYLNGDWKAYMDYRIEAEQEALYGRRAA